MKALLAPVAALALSGCAIIAPYDDEFQCERNRDFGQCTDVQGAYRDAVSGTNRPSENELSSVRKGPSARGRSASRRGSDTRDEREVAGVERHAGPPVYNSYKAAEYRELEKLIEAPVTPVVEPPKVLRSLIVAYGGKGQALYMPRYVYFFVSDGRFVLGNYLNEDGRSVEGSAVVYPNSALIGE